jgi:hypothetical protein
VTGLDAEYRRQLLLLNRERIEVAYVKAHSRGLDDPIILVLDLQDEGAADLTQMTGTPREQIEQAREECQRDDVVPTQVLAVPRHAVTCLVSPVVPGGPKEAVRPNPAGTFRVVAIASNGSSFADFPSPPVSYIDQIGG